MKQIFFFKFKLFTLTTNDNSFVGYRGFVLHVRFLRKVKISFKQGRIENSRGPEKVISGIPMTSLISNNEKIIKTGEQYSKALIASLNRALVLIRPC